MSTTAEPRSSEPIRHADSYRTSPDQNNSGWPAGVAYIVGNEACERFSFYGMRAILPTHLATLYVAAGNISADADSLAKQTTHLFFAGVYALPMVGALMAERLAGKFRTILWLSLVYCAGHLALTLGEKTLLGMYIGLALIAIGSGGIKPCVSANVGDQFGAANWFRLRTVYQIFYFTINFGSFFAYLLIPWIEGRWGPSIAFSVPGVLMFLATWIFWLGRHAFVHVPPKPGGKLGILDTLSSTCLFLSVGHFFFTKDYALWIQLVATAGFFTLGLILSIIRQRKSEDDGFLAVMVHSTACYLGLRARPDSSTSPGPIAEGFWGPAESHFGQEAADGAKAVLRVLSIFIFVSIWWAIYDQKATTWIQQASLMDLHVTESLSVKNNQILALNPALIMILIPLMTVLFSKLERIGIEASPLRRMVIGLWLGGVAFLASALLQTWIEARGPGKVWFVWQAIPYLILTISEILVSATGLEFAYAQAPKRMKSAIMGFWLLAVSLGNVLVAIVTAISRTEHWTFHQGFWLWTGIMFATCLLFTVRSVFFVAKDQPQE